MPDVYDAGAIRAHADLDRDPFIEGLQVCRQQGRAFAAERFTATADVDTVQARRDLAQLQLMMRRVSEEGVDIDVDTDGIAAAIAELEALRREQDRVDRQTVTSSRTRVAAHKEEVKQLGLLRTAIELLGPPLIPLAGAALAASTAFIGLGVAGIAALKGIQAEYKAGTPLGLKYAGMLREVKSQANTLGHTAAENVLGGLNRALAAGNVQLPEFNAHLGNASRHLGDITQHLVGGLIGGFNAWYPLIRQAEIGVDHLVQRFEEWATGPAGQHFMQTLITDMRTAGPIFGDLARAVADIVTAFHPVGTVMLQAIGAVSRAIDNIPVPVLQAAATAYIAFRSAVVVTRGLEAAAAVLYKLSGAELAAARSATILAAAQTRAARAGIEGGFGPATLSRSAGSIGTLERSAGLLATATRSLVPFAIGWTVATIGINAAANATEKWRKSTDEAKLVMGQTLNFAKDLFTFNWSHLAQDVRDTYAGGVAIRDRQYEQTVIDAYSPRGNYGTGFFGGFGGDTRYQPSLRAGVQTPAALAASQGSPFPGGDVKALGDAREELKSYATALAEARSRGRELNIEQTALAESGMRGTQAWRDNAAAIAANNTAGIAASHNYSTLKANIDGYVDSLRQSAKIQNATRDRYSGRQATFLGGLERTTFAQAGNLTEGAQGLSAYASAIQKAIKGEEQWTKVTDDDTVSIRGNTFERKAWGAALVQTNGNVDRAIGLMLGHKKALDNDRSALIGAVDMQAKLNKAIGEAELKYQLNDTQLNTYASVLGITSDRLATGEISTRRFVSAIGRVKGVVDQGSVALQGWVTAVTAFEEGADTAASRAQLLAAAMVSLQGDTISWQQAVSHAADANQQFVDAFRNANKNVVNAKKGLIDYRNAGAAPLLDALANMQTQAAGTSAAVYQHVNALHGAKAASKAAAETFRADTTDALIKEHAALGLTRDEAEKLANRYFHWPKKATTQIESLGTAKTNGLLTAIGRQLEILTGTNWKMFVDADTSAAQGKIAALRYNASKEIVIGAGIRANALGGIVYAARGEIHEPMIARVRPGTVRVWAEPETGGEAYIPLANDHRRPRARAIARETVRHLGGNVVGFADGGKYGGYHGVTGGSGSGSGGSGAGSDGSGSSGPSKAEQTRRDIERLLRELTHDRLGNRTLKQLDKAASSTVLAYANSLLDQARRAMKLHIGGVDSEFIKGIRAETGELRKDLRERDKLAQQRERIDQRIAGIRQKMQQERSTVAGAITGGFDIGTSGNGYQAGIASTLEQQLADAQKFADLRKQAKALGLDKRLLRQITREGPETAGANLEAIVQGGRGYIKGVNADYGKLTDLANRIGGGQAREIYGHRLEQAQDRLHHVAEQQRDATKAVNGTLREIRHDLNSLRQDVRDDRRRTGGHR